MDSIHDEYLQQLKHYFAFPQSIGIVGGKPNSSLYFVACQGMLTVVVLSSLCNNCPHYPLPVGDYLFFLDPHFVQKPVVRQGLQFSTEVIYGMKNELESVRGCEFHVLGCSSLTKVVLSL